MQIFKPRHECMLIFILYVGGEKMARVAYRSADVDLMARMMRAEAEGEGEQGMLICRKCHC